MSVFSAISSLKNQLNISSLVAHLLYKPGIPSTQMSIQIYYHFRTQNSSGSKSMRASLWRSLYCSAARSGCAGTTSSSDKYTPQPKTANLSSRLNSTCFCAEQEESISPRFKNGQTTYFNLAFPCLGTCIFSFLSSLVLFQQFIVLFCFVIPFFVLVSLFLIYSQQGLLAPPVLSKKKTKPK